MAEPALVDVETLRRWALPDPGSDKESRGRVLVVGGGASTPGAVRLAGEASLRVGGGKLQVATAGSVAVALGTVMPEAMVRGLPETESGDLAPEGADTVVGLAEGAAAVLLGPGMSDPAVAVGLLGGVVPSLRPTVVVDALASAYVTENPGGLKHLDGGCVLTLNPKETMLTLGEREVPDDLTGPARELASATGAVVLCGGTEKVVAAPDGEMWTVRVGGAGLGVSGSGDVQAGLVAGLAARGATPAQAAVWGAWLHGSAGERLAARIGAMGFLAGELPPVVPGLLTEVSG